ncbi:hypothetical protein BR93DRAFT_929971 [Coniochaeta sp. PMI_546]|nr:hypothetical protein BR93DRAFT_929971 [Coniochaeta sp. PMI_546]
MCSLSCHTVAVMALILTTLVSRTVAVCVALMDPSPTMSAIDPAASLLANRLALRIESIMATMWLSFVGLLSLGVAAACLSFGPRDHEHAKHCKMV